jgi:hypothetical protein
MNQTHPRRLRHAPVVADRHRDLAVEPERLDLVAPERHFGEMCPGSLGRTLPAFDRDQRGVRGVASLERGGVADVDVAHRGLSGGGSRMGSWGVATSVAGLVRTLAPSSERPTDLR